MQCAVVLEKFHKTGLIRADSDFGLTLTPHRIHLAGIQGSDQKLPYLVWCPPVKTEMNRGFLHVVRPTFLRLFLARKCKLPNPQEAALRCPNLTPFVDAEE